MNKKRDVTQNLTYLKLEQLEFKKIAKKQIVCAMCSATEKNKSTARRNGWELVQNNVFSYSEYWLCNVCRWF